jgi:hypothetical protein
MINEPGTGYWDFSNEVAPQWIDYNTPGANPAPGPINVGGNGNVTGAGGMPVGGSNPILTTGTQGGAASGSGNQISSYPPNTGSYLPTDYRERMNAFVAANPNNPAYGTGSSPSQSSSSQFTPTPFMTPGLTFQPRTQFGQQASAPLNLSQQGRAYGQIPGGPNTAQQTPAFQSMRPGGTSGFMPQFQNPYGPQPQQYRSMGQQPTQISQQPQAPRQPDADGIAALIRSAMQNKYGNAG